MVTPEVQAERDRCANLVRDLAEIWAGTAAKVRKEGSFTTRSLWPPFKKVTVVRPGWERYAVQVDDAVAGLRVLEKVVRETE